MKIVFTLLFCAHFAHALAQDSTYALSPHMIGGSASMMTGYGLTYGYFFNEATVLKAKAFAFIETDGTEHEETIFEFGLEFQQNLITRGPSRAYFLAGGYYSVENDIYDYNLSNISRDEYTWTEFAVGAGVGLEYALWRHLLLHIDGGFTFRTTDRESTPASNNDYYPRKYLGVAAGGGIMYRF